MTLSEFDRTHVGEILTGHGTWFTADLLRLMAKADPENLTLLVGAFPDVGAAYIAWRNGTHDGD